MSGNTLEGRTKNEIIRSKFEVALIRDKMSKTDPRWFSHVKWRSIEE